MSYSYQCSVTPNLFSSSTHFGQSTTVEIVQAVGLPKKFRNPTNASELERLGTFPLKILKEKKKSFHISSKNSRMKTYGGISNWFLLKEVLPPLQLLPGLLVPRINFQNQHCTVVHKLQVICTFWDGKKVEKIMN